MTDPNLILDRVTHVSLVDEPAVGDSEFVVMKRTGEDAPENLQDALEVVKGGRSLSSANIERLAGIYQDVKGSHPKAARQIKEFLRETSHADQDVESILEADTNMSDPDISELVEAVQSSTEQVAKAAEAASEAAEAASDAAEAATPTSPEGPGGSEGGEANQEGTQEGEGSGRGQGSEPQEPAIPEAARERMEAYEEQLVEAGLLDEDDIPEWDDGDSGRGDEDDIPETLEKRFNAIEKALDNQGGRQGSASLLDGVGEGDRISKSAPGGNRADVMSQVKQQGGN